MPQHSASQASLSCDITYSFYPFLAISNLPNIPPQDVNYLELQGCFRVPTRALLDDFLQQYFLHVHPMLPLVNEGDFWEICGSGSRGGSESHERISLLVFQAILFAATPYISRETITALGHPTASAVRASLYRRAKLLYDLESESSPLSIAQASLLLSFWGPSSTRKPNTSWLSLAIQHAKAAEAHHYAAMPTFSATTHPMQRRKQKTLKKVWWCCIIRDRTLGLLMRRPIQITRDHFDFGSSRILGPSDLEDEFDKSKVYSKQTKRSLAEILAQTIQLYVLLTDILMVAFPLDDVPGWGREVRHHDSDRMRECKASLKKWHSSSLLKFPLSKSAQGSTNGSNSSREFRHDSAILYTNLMYMYYYSSCIVLCHHEVLQMVLQAASNGGSTIYENRHELNAAAEGMTECLKELVRRKLIRWLPVSTVACAALPTVLSILDVKFSAPNNTSTESSTTRSVGLKQHRLNVLVEAMKSYRPQGEGVDWVSEIMRHVSNLTVPGDPRTRNGQQHLGVSDWASVRDLEPSSYLRLALALDVNLSKGRLPEDGDFPASLRGLLTDDFSRPTAPVQMDTSSRKRNRIGVDEVPGLDPALAASLDITVDFMPPLPSESDSYHSPNTHSPHSNSDSQIAILNEVDMPPSTDQERVMQWNREKDEMLLPSNGMQGLGGGSAENGIFSLGDDSPSSGSDFDGVYVDAPMTDLPSMPAQWGEDYADGAGTVDNRADWDRAKVLLEALLDGDMGDCMV